MTALRPTRRQLLATAGAAGLGALAGCAGVLGDEGTEMTLMIERVMSEGSHHDGGGMDDDGMDGDHGGDDHGGVSMDELGHTCAHLEELEPFSLDAGDSRDESASATVHEPYTVTLPGETGYVSCEPREPDSSHGVFLADGTATVLTGATTEEETDVGDCAEIDRYVLVEPDEGQILLELTADA